MHGQNHIRFNFSPNNNCTRKVYRFQLT